MISSIYDRNVFGQRHIQAEDPSFIKDPNSIAKVVIPKALTVSNDPRYWIFTIIALILLSIANILRALHSTDSFFTNAIITSTHIVPALLYLFFKLNQYRKLGLRFYLPWYKECMEKIPVGRA